MRSKRLKYRALNPRDAHRVATYAGDWDVASMTARIPYPYTEAAAEAWIADLSRNEFVRAVLLDGQLIGAIGYFPGTDRSAEIGYWIGKPWWGQGFATEAAEALVRHCFARARFDRLTCCHFVDNPRSARVIEKLGFKIAGSSSTFCEARRREIALVRYERRRSMLSLFRRRAA